MKMQLIKLVAEQIYVCEVNKSSMKKIASQYFDNCDVDDESFASQYNFKSLNICKNLIRVIDKKLINLRNIQIELKKMSTYTTSKMNYRVVNDKMQIVNIITQKEA